MTDSGDMPHLEELEPLAETPTAPERPPAMTVVAVAGGAPAPAYNPVADKEYYRFLFAGLVMAIGCLMPFGPQLSMVGYKTVRGAICLLIALGLIWSAWASIHQGRMIKGLLRWVALAFFPLLLGVFDMLYAFNPGSAVNGWVQRVGPDASIESWGEFFSSLGTVLQPGDQIGEFLRYYGPGRLVVFVGAVLAEFFFVMGIVGGAKKIKEQKAERRKGAPQRRKG
ncbi:MAG: hypothetical protein AAF628_16475 [Planctomycetota bacterium]